MKNFKLLLASTAILSTGALAVMADEPKTTTLDAKIGIVQKSSVSGGMIDFGVITTDHKTGGEGAIFLIVNQDGSVDESSTAEVIVNPTVTPIRVYVPGMGEEISGLEDYVALGLDKFIELVSDENPTEEDIAQATNTYNTYAGLIGSGVTVEQFNAIDGTFNIQHDSLFIMRDSDGKSCGYVEPGAPRMKYSREFGGASEFYMGGKFTLDKDYNPGNGANNCTGSTTVTVVLDI